MSDAKKIFSIDVDMRESRSGVPQYLQRCGTIDVRMGDLELGDYVLSEKVVIERKDATDFVNSIMDNRLFGQVAHMKASFETVVVILEGDVFSTRSEIAPASIRGAISWMSVIEGLSVVHTRNAPDTGAIIEIMARHAQAGLGYEVPMRSQKPKNPQINSLYLVEGLPGCGASTARLLINHFGSAESVFSASLASLCDVKGIGKATAQKIRDALEYNCKVEN
jgi:Fanconi anemia group M protein